MALYLEHLKAIFTTVIASHKSRRSFDESRSPAGKATILGNTNYKGCEYGLKGRRNFSRLLALISLIAGCVSTPQELRSRPRESTAFHVDVPYDEVRFHILNRLAKCFVGDTNAAYFFPKVHDEKPEQSMSFDIYGGASLAAGLLQDGIQHLHAVAACKASGILSA